ncbi:substrate-binding domain-containing protein [Clostridium thermarum]|uniref:substrate-binding domain-containing protein n=1 Tax=Clostridium thermarum TaxID=1716543 RepID=UPI0013D32D77|nr:substrate-binding domain-containing protein [Clostridium thermarum]
MCKRIIFYGCYLLLLLLLLTSCTGQYGKDSTSKKKIELILKTSYGYHWGTIKMGAYSAAKELGLEISYTAPYDEKNPVEQIKLMEQAIERKVDAIILGAGDPEALSEITERAYEEGIPVIVIDSGVNTYKVNSYVTTNNHEAGKQAGNVLIDLVGKYAEIAVLSIESGDMESEYREDGLYSVLAKYPGLELVAKEYCLSNEKLAYDLTKEILLKNPELNGIVALNEAASEGAAQAVEELNLVGKVKIVAFNNTTQEIDYMDKGVIQATIIQNPFSIGYLGVKQAHDVLNNKRAEKYVYINSKVIDRENMYMPENQKLLFPFIR